MSAHEPPAHTERLGEILVRMGALAPADVDRVVQVQAKTGGSFGHVAVRQSLVTADQVRAALAHQFGYMSADGIDVPQGMSRELIMLFDTMGRSAERIRILRSHLMIHHFQNGERMLAVTGIGDNSGSTYIAANLATSIAQLGRRVLLIDANLRAPRMRQLFGIDNPLGLSDVLAGRASVDNVIMSNLIENLAILPAGTIPPNPQELLGSPRFQEMMAQFKSVFGVIIIDTCGDEGIADAEQVWNEARSVLLVARRGRSRYNHARRMADGIRAMGATVVGTVMNGYAGPAPKRRRAF
ncbi:MAG: polysaccharide biosynthesis tyrosine autokinase [Alphaproteobacteria bacterium]|nr:polysaccharide biosynthesis tyrosine autokinase [Alphaproteobacteria bacterium]